MQSVYHGFKYHTFLLFLYLCMYARSNIMVKIIMIDLFHSLLLVVLYVGKDHTAKFYGL